MTATYTNQPGTRPIDTVRFEIDAKDCTTETTALISDEEIQYLIDNNRHILLAAAAAAEAVAAKYTGTPTSKMVGDLQVSYGSGKATEYTALAKSLRNRAYRKAGAHVYAGGLTESDKDRIESDSDRVDPVFTLGGMDHEGTDRGDYERGVIDY